MNAQAVEYVRLTAVKTVQPKIKRLVRMQKTDKEEMTAAAMAIVMVAEGIMQTEVIVQSEAKGLQIAEISNQQRRLFR